MKITLITTNPGKVREFKSILEPDILVEHIDYDYLELRSDDPEAIAKQAAEHVYQKLKKPVVVEDSGLFIEALKGFPGTCSAYVHKRLGLPGILKLMENIDDRKCWYKSAVGYCDEDGAVSFLGTETGQIAPEIRGENGFGHDPIFMPDGSDETYGEMKGPENKKKFRRRAIEKLLSYLKDED